MVNLVYTAIKSQAEIRWCKIGYRIISMSFSSSRSGSSDVESSAESMDKGGTYDIKGITTYYFIIQKLYKI